MGQDNAVAIALCLPSRSRRATYSKNDEINVVKRSSITWLVTAQFSMERHRVLLQQETIWKQVFCGPPYWKTNEQTTTKRRKQLLQVRFKFMVSFGDYLPLVNLLLPHTNWLTWGLPSAEDTYLKVKSLKKLALMKVLSKLTQFLPTACA